MLFRELSLNESFNEWNTVGYLVYDNTFEQLERYKEKSKIKNSEFFYFRMDGTDEIIIEFDPVLTAESSKGRKSKQEFPIDIISFKFRGAIYDSEDLTKGNIDQKLKKLYFWDYYYNKAINMNQRISCGDYLNYVKAKDKTKEVGDIRKLSNEERLTKNGDLIKYICTEKLGARVSDKWESGDRKTFYVSTPHAVVYDDLNYLIKGYYEGNGYPAWFSFDRYNEEFTLKSYRTIFEGYKDEIKEVFHFNDPTNPNSGIVPPRSDLENSFSIPSFSDILSYKYTKMSGADNMQELTSRIIHGHDAKNKKFVSVMADGHIKNVKKVYTGMLGNFLKGNQNPLFIINKDKIDNVNTIETQTLERTNIVKDGIKPALLLNDAIYFEVLGLPNRQPGTFIEIESDTDTEGIWEDRFLGTWFVTEVRHKIRPDGYVNNILAVKPNMSESFTYPDGTEA